MVISHKHKFIFIKTSKTAGSSIEVYLSKECGLEDVLTPIIPSSDEHEPRNYQGFFNPFRDFFTFKSGLDKSIFGDFLDRRKFYNHIPAKKVRARVLPSIWSEYFKFAVERNPYDKVYSLYCMLNYRMEGRLSVDRFFDSGMYKKALNIKYYTDQNGKVIVDKVLKFENLHDELKETFDRLGVAFYEGLNVNEKGNYKKHRNLSYLDEFSVQQIAMITYFYDKEFSLWGYEKYS